MTRQNYSILSLSFVILLLNIFSPYRDSINNYSLVLGSVISILSVSLIIKVKEENAVFKNPSLRQSLDFIPLFGVVLEIFGMYYSHFLAAFYIVWIPFTYYLLISLLITFQFHFSIKLIISKRKSKPVIPV